MEEPTRQPQRQPLSEIQPRREREWEFNVDWQDIKNGSDTIMARLEKGKKLKKQQRIIFVQRIVSQVRNKAPAATRRIFVQVMNDIKRKYRASFEHELANGKIGKRSITKKMMDKFDNDKRPPRRTRLEQQAPISKAAYGCIMWRAPLPEDQTPASQEEIRADLKEYFTTTRPAMYDWNMIGAKLLLTYSTQRRDINRQAEALEKLRKAELKRKRMRQHIPQTEEELVDDPAVETANLADMWPFLFQARGMRIHFKELTGVDFPACIEKFITSNQMEHLLDFCECQLKQNNEDARKLIKKMKKTVKREESEETKQSLKFTCLILLLLIFFKENSEEVMRCVEVSYTSQYSSSSKFFLVTTLVLVTVLY